MLRCLCSDLAQLCCSPFLSREAANDSSTFPPFGLLTLLSFCTFTQSPLSYLAEAAPSLNTFKQQEDLHPVLVLTSPGLVLAEMSTWPGDS